MYLFNASVHRPALQAELMTGEVRDEATTVDARFQHCILEDLSASGPHGLGRCTGVGQPDEVLVPSFLAGSHIAHWQAPKYRLGDIVQRQEALGILKRLHSQRT